MANKDHIDILKSGVTIWNKWRDDNRYIVPDLSFSNLRHQVLDGANFSHSILSNADFTLSVLIGANFSHSDLIETTFSSANLFDAEFINANLTNSSFWGATLNGANLSGAKLIGTNLKNANLVDCILHDSILMDCKVYGISAWNIQTNSATVQSNLIITRKHERVISIDNIKMAQFVYLILNNLEIRDMINTMTGKAVLILGRFGERKVLLECISDELKKRNYVPIKFDFDRPLDRNMRETVQTLASLCKFVIADLSFPQSTPLESLAVFYNLRLPFVPLIETGQKPFSMFSDFGIEIGYIPPVVFRDAEHIKAIIDQQILIPAEDKYREIRSRKQNLQ
jgi:hypothetical protein